METRYLAYKLVAHNNEVHGEGFWVITFCNDLSAHLDTYRIQDSHEE